MAASRNEELTSVNNEEPFFSITNLRIIPEPEESSEGLPSFESDQESDDGWVRPGRECWKQDLKMYEDIDPNQPVLFFVCRGNTCRSAMAVGLARAYVEKYNLPFYIDSFGVSAWSGIMPYPNALRACHQLGLDISEHRSCDMNDLYKYNKPIEQAFAVICMEQWQRKKVLKYLGPRAGKTLLKEEVFLLADEDIPDPIGDDAKAYRKMLVFLKPLVEKHLRQMNNLYYRLQMKKQIAGQLVQD